ncbi:MAG: glycoside hydrolase family 6 protein [Dermatophilaceae bacterium]
MPSTHPAPSFRANSGVGAARRATALILTLVVGLTVAVVASEPWSTAAAARVGNPFVGASRYVNPDYAKQVDASIARTTDTQLRRRMTSVKNYPTAVWLDRAAAIDGGAANGGRLSLVQHLDTALAQKKTGVPMTVQLVIYNMPGRDCAALASNGEIPLTEAGLESYRTTYIDRIAGILGQPKYADLRIATVIEVDSLPNLVTNQSDPECARAKESGIQVEAYRYALDALGALPNVYNYLDIGHSGWLGWDSNLSETVALYTDVVRGSGRGFANVTGFVTNSSNYTPTTEPYLPDPDLNLGGTPVKGDQNFYQWNPNFDEADFTAALYQQFVAAGWPKSIGMLIDTARNGWGGPARPTAVSTSPNVSTYVAESRVDRRTHRGSWCNLAGAGMGMPPQAAPADNPASHLHAYVWVKPPGESDGASTAIANTEGKSADPMCDPSFRAPNLGGQLTGAMPNAPLAGYWFHEQFSALVRNAFPAIPESGTTTTPTPTPTVTTPTPIPTVTTPTSTPTPTVTTPTPTPTVTTPTPTPTAGPTSSTTSDWLHTSGNAIVDSAGKRVWLTGANWFGMNTSRRLLDGLHSQNIEWLTKGMADRGINVVRVPVSTQLLREWKSGQVGQSNGQVNLAVNPELAGKSDVDVWDYFLVLCKKYGLKVIVDMHSADADDMGHLYPVWFKGSVSTEDFYSTWEWMVRRHRADDTIVGVDIKNEPHGKVGESPRAKWDGSTDADNFRQVAQTAGRRILAINPQLLVLVEGVESSPKPGKSWNSTNPADFDTNWWGGNLRDAATYPINLGSNQDQLVYSPHDYGPSVFRQPWFAKTFSKQSLTDEVWRPNWFYLHEGKIAPLLIGEWGGFLDGGDNERWLTYLRDFIAEHRLSHTFWVLNPNSGDTGGLLTSWTGPWDDAKLALLDPVLWRHQGKFVSLDHQVPLGGAGSTTGVTLAAATGGGLGGGTGGGGSGDTAAPSTPGPITVTGTTASSVALSWRASTDNVGVSGYVLLRNGVEVRTVTGTTVSDTGLSADAAYGYTVRAVDAAGNRSAPSALLTARTAKISGSMGCQATYAVTDQWPGGFTAAVTVTNRGATPTTGWTVQWRLAEGQSLTNVWSATAATAAGQVTARPAEWNAVIAPGSSASFGFQAAGPATVPAAPTCVSSG